MVDSYFVCGELFYDRFRFHGHFIEPDAGGIMKRSGNSCRNGDEACFGDTFGSERSSRVLVFDERCKDLSGRIFGAGQ
jgi:hypothetical protein